MRHVLVISALLVSCSLVFTAQGPSSQSPGSPVPDAGGAAPPRDGGSAPVGAAAVIRGRVVAAETSASLRGVQIAAGGRRTLTDEDGRYEIADLPAGRYTVSARKTGYLPLSYGQRRPLEPGQPIDLAPGAVFDDASFVLPRGSVIAGRVVDRYGDPLTGMVVRADRYGYVDGHRTVGPFPLSLGYQVVESSTDDRGEFRLFGLPPGEYIVSASLPSGQTSAPGPDEQGYGRTYYPGATAAAGAEAIVLRLGEERLDVAIQMMVSRTATLSGIALDANGRPYAGASLSLREGARSNLIRQPVIVGSDGTFSLPGVPPGEYVLDVRGRPVDPLGVNDRGALPILVDGHDLPGLVVRARQGFPARGRIVGSDGRSPQGLAPGSVLIRFRPVGDDIEGVRSVPSAADATFEVPSLQGQHAVSASVSPPSLEWTVRRIVHQGQDVTDGTFDFSRGPVEGIVIEVTREITSFSGTVRDADGGSVRDCVVVVFADDPARWTPPSRFIRTARPDRDGRFSIRGLPPGAYVAVALEYLEPGQETSPAVLAALHQTAAGARVSLREAETEHVDLRLWEGF